MNFEYYYNSILQLLTLKRYAIPCSLCTSLSSTQQQDQAAKLLTIVFQNMHKYVRDRPTAPNSPEAVENTTMPASRSGMGDNSGGRIKDHAILFLETMISTDVKDASKLSILRLNC